MVPGGCRNGNPATPTQGPTVPSPRVSQSAAGYGQQCLTTTGCSLDYFDVPTDQFLEVGRDIAPGKWNLKRGDTLCRVYRFNAAIDSHPFYGLGNSNRDSVGARGFSTFDFRGHFLIQQPSGNYKWHSSVIAEHDFIGVGWPDVPTFTIEGSDYMIVVKTLHPSLTRGC